MSITTRSWLPASLVVLAVVAAAQHGTTYAALTDLLMVPDNRVGASVWDTPFALYLPAECTELDPSDNDPSDGSAWGYTIVIGSHGPDDLAGDQTDRNKSDLIFGLGGNDTIQGGNQDDCLVGGEGDDDIGGDRQGENGKDVLFGGSGDDVLRGGNGKDVLYSGDGTDTAGGNNGKDKLYGDAGNDALYGGNATDLMNGGKHTDTCTGGRALDVYEECEDGDASSMATTEMVPLQKSAPLDSKTEEETETELLVPGPDALVEPQGDGGTETEQATEEESPVEELEGAQP